MNTTRRGDDEFQLLAKALAGSPQAATAVHLLGRGLCTAHVAGELSSPTAAVVVPDFRPERVLAFGHDLDALWHLLCTLRHWKTVNTSPGASSVVSARMEERFESSVRRHECAYFVLTVPPPALVHPLVRRLTPDDEPLIEEAPPFLQQGRLFGGPRALLREGIIAGAVDQGKLVATAHTATMTADYADIGVATLDAYRRQGIAAAAASLVCQAVQAMNRVPVWDCATDNVASVHLAEKLGFRPIDGRVDLTRGDG